MKLYDRKETAPLRFYKFFMYVYLPVAAFSALYSIVTYFAMRHLTMFVFEDWYIWFIISIAIALVFLYVFLFFGLLRWKKTTLYLFVALLAVTVVTCAVNIYYFFAVADPTTFFNYIPYDALPGGGFDSYFIAILEMSMKISVIFSSVVAIALSTLIFFYFYKRKLLFDGVPYRIPPNAAKQYPPQPYYPPPPYYQQPPQYLQQPYNPPQHDVPALPACPACGTPRPSHWHKFCGNCGRKYD